MPIDNLTYPENIKPQDAMTLVARIKKGNPQNEKGHVGRDTDHFRFKLEKKFDNVTHPVLKKTYNEILVDLYKEKPRRFTDVMFRAITPNQAFDNWYEEYSGNNIVRRRCNRVEQVKHRIEGGGYSYDKIPCIKNAEQPCRCVPRGRLECVLLDFNIRTGVYGKFMFETGSITDISSIFQALSGVDMDFGGIRRIKWIVERVKEKQARPKIDKQGNVIDIMPIETWIMNIRPTEQSVYDIILPELQRQGVMGDNLLPEGATHMLQSSNAIEDETIDDTHEMQTPLNVEKFAETMSAIVEADISVEFVVNAFSAYGDDAHTYTGDREYAVALVAWVYAEHDPEFAIDIVQLACENQTWLSCEDAQIELDKFIAEWIKANQNDK